MSDDEDDESFATRAAEMEVLQSMFVLDEEISFPDPEDLFYCVLKLPLDADDGAGPVDCELACRLVAGHPAVRPEISIACDRIRRAQNDRIKAALFEAVDVLDEGEMILLFVIDWVKENGPRFFAQEAAASSAPTEGGRRERAANAANAAPRQPKGFMREWCSFVSLYKDSYISGPNRFEVMTSLAKDRGLKITGMGIAGKPGGLVAEGDEGDLVEFMELMRTVFFETLNPRGRKLTTRLQERWPLDDEVERYEAAEIAQKLKDDYYRAADREKIGPAAAALKWKPGEKERFEKSEAEDRERLQRWERKAKRSMPEGEVKQLIEAGPPAKCTTPGVYDRCGCEAPPTIEEIEARRVFKDFTVFSGKEGYETSYQEAGKLFKDMGQMEGFDAMFAYRFS